MKKPLDDASEAFATEQKEMQRAAKQVKTMQAAVADELAALATLLR